MLGIYCRTSKERDLVNSSISQQRNAGIKFAEENKFEYELYEDEGKSGFTTSDDDFDPFNNRPAFINLINDIKDRKIKKVWVWEHSRLSRNEYASAYIFRTFRKYNITLYENKKEYDLNDPIKDLNRKILDAVANYERHLIINRITRGLHKSINEGKRVYKKLYGYQNNGKDENGKASYIPVESEMNNYKYAFDKYMEGASLMKICLEIHKSYKIEKRQLPNYAYNLGKMLRGYQYTGYQLTLEGIGILKRFRKNEIENLKSLLNRKFWVKSFYYPVEIISIEDWVSICERLQLRGRKLNVNKKERILRASKDIATGIIECGICGKKYYYHEQKSDKIRMNGERTLYLSYFHIATINSAICKQRPRSYKLDHINEIFKIFYFFFYVVFDNKNERIKESQRNIKQAQVKIKEKMAKFEKEIPVIEKRLTKYQKNLENPNLDDSLLEILLRNIKSSEDKLHEINIELSKLKIDFEIENDKFSKTEDEAAYYDVKEKVNGWFYKLNVEEQRNELVKTIDACKIFGHYLIIDAGKIVFLFDIKDNHKFDMNLLEKLNNDEIFKDYIVNMTGKREAKKHNEKRILNINLNRTEEIRMKVFQFMIKNFGINYDISEKSNLIAFVSFRGLSFFDVETFGNEK